MKALSKAVTMLLLTALSGMNAAHAVNVWHDDPNLRITRVFAITDGSYALSVNIEASGCKNINNPKQYTLAVGVNGVTADAAMYIYVAAMAAMLHGKRVEFLFNDAVAECSVNRLKIIN